VLVRPRIDLLADCGWSASSCCRHVDISTVVHRRLAVSTPCPLCLPAGSPGRAQGPQVTARGNRARSAGAAASLQVSGPSGPPTPMRCTTRARAPMTGRDPTGTRSPQPVHIPGDNFSMCRRRSPAGTPLATAFDESNPCVDFCPRVWTTTGTTTPSSSGRHRGQRLCRPPDDTAAMEHSWIEQGTARSGRVGPEGPRRNDSAAQRRSGRPLEAVRSGGPRCHCLARLLMRAVSSVTCV
jgi:hypothetical protein